MTGGGSVQIDRRALALLLTGEHVPEHAVEVAELLAEGSPLEVGEHVAKGLLRVEEGLAGDDAAEDLELAAWAFERGGVQLLLAALAARDAAGRMRGGSARSSGRARGAAREQLWQDLAEQERLTPDELVHLRRFAAAIRTAPAPVREAGTGEAGRPQLARARYLPRNAAPVQGVSAPAWGPVADLLAERRALPTAAVVAAEAGCGAEAAQEAIDAYVAYHGLAPGPHLFGCSNTGCHRNGEEVAGAEPGAWCLGCGRPLQRFRPAVPAQGEEAAR